MINKEASGQRRKVMSNEAVVETPKKSMIPNVVNYYEEASGQTRETESNEAVETRRNNVGLHNVVNYY